jgi:two-component sensor histidine kinase
VIVVVIVVFVLAAGVGIWAADQHRRDTALLKAAETRAMTSEVRAKNAEDQLQAAIGEIRHLADERIPAAVLALNHPHAPIVGLLTPRESDAGVARALRKVLESATEAVAGERDRVDAAARSAMRGATAKVQSLLYQIQSLLQDLQHENDDPRLLELDFRNELALRRIQATAVLCEAWPGLARGDSQLAEIVLGAQSRVPGYSRIKVANHLREQRLAVVARAVEPLAIAVAELLANATAYSHPDTEVPVTVQQSGGRGALVVIDDGGIGMEQDDLTRARRLLAGPEGVLLTELGNPPQAGFAVVGRLVRQYGFSCHVESSPYGGVRAMLRIPANLLTVIDDEHTLSVLVPGPVAGSGGGRAEDGPGADTTRFPAVASLPSRRRRAPRENPAAGRPAAVAQAPAAVPVRSPEQSGALWGALQDGTRGGRDAARPASAGAGDGAGTGAPTGAGDSAGDSAGAAAGRAAAVKATSDDQGEHRS